jgi:DNA-binding Lrp family transcriptional regulator
MKICEICKEMHQGMHSSYYNEGINKEIAFVFSCPGNAEKENGFPIAGETGRTFDTLLERLKENGIIKNYNCRYDFRITNATINIEAISETNRTEAKNAEIKKESNITRLFEQIKDYKVIICFWEKAKIAVSFLKNKVNQKTKIISVRHLSPMAFIKEEKKTRKDRAEFVFEQIKNQYI